MAARFMSTRISGFRWREAACSPRRMLSLNVIERISVAGHPAPRVFTAI
jgi:hypothetical protein